MFNSMGYIQYKSAFGESMKYKYKHAFAPSVTMSILCNLLVLLAQSAKIVFY